MKAAFGVYKYKDKLYIFPGEFGHSPFFAIVDLDKGEVLELRENPYKAYEGKGKFKLIAELLKDVQYFVGYEYGEDVNKLIERFGIIPIKVSEEDFEKALEKVRKAEIKEKRLVEI